VSHTPQTTRTALLGVVHHGTAEIALLDTPGLHRPRTALGRVMNEAAREATRGADVVVFVAEVPKTEILERAAERATSAAPVRVHPGDATLLADLPKGVPAILVLNKIDRVRNKGLMLPTLVAFEKLHEFAAIVPISALREDGVAVVLDEIAKALPVGPWRYGEDDVTDKPVRFFAAEYVREQILRATQDEVPHAAAVGIDQFLEPAGRGAVQIDATIHVERPGQKKILVGAGGAMLKRIGTAARLRIEELVGRKVNLKLWVRVTPDWRESAKQLEELGYGASGREAPDAVIFAELPDVDLAGDETDVDDEAGSEGDDATDEDDLEDEQ
jgi:GTP-binding protein Era